MFVFLFVCLGVCEYVCGVCVGMLRVWIFVFVGSVNGVLVFV